MPKETRTASQKIIASLKGLRDHLQEDEQPVINIPGIWDSSQQQSSTACDIVLTNQRLLGYYKVNFPRERFFLDSLPLSTIRTVTLQQKKDPVFREILVYTGERQIYIRSSRQKIELLNTALQQALERHTSVEGSPVAAIKTRDQKAQPLSSKQQELHSADTSTPATLLNITLLFTGGLLLEVLGALLWAGTHSVQIGAPLVIAGFVSWSGAMFLRKQRPH